MSDHSAPGAGQSRKSRWTLLILFLVFIAPAAGGWLWYTFGSDFSRQNYGTLYEPARPLAEIGFGDHGGSEAGFSSLRGTWTLVYLGAEECGERCLQQIDKMNRIRLGQSKNTKRIRMLFLSPAPLDTEVLDQVTALMPGGIVAHPDASSLEELVPLMLHPGEAAARARHRVYLVDPIGNLVLSYEADADPAGMNKDLARLLRASQIG